MSKHGVKNGVIMATSGTLVVIFFPEFCSTINVSKSGNYLRVCPRENQAKSKKIGTGQISDFDETLPEDRL